MAHPLKTKITTPGQTYIDEAIVVAPKDTTPLERAISASFGHAPRSPIVVGHERVRLNWVSPRGRAK